MLTPLPTRPLAHALLRGLLLLALLLVGRAGRAQQLTRLEYFYDTDPGHGLGQQVAFPAAAGSQDFTYTASLAGLAPGFHTLYTRVLEQRPGRKAWSLPNVRPVYVGPVGTGLDNLTYLEYFFDADPGYRLGYGVPLTAPGTSVSQNFVADLSALAPGFHTLYVRVKNAAGAWSISLVRPIYVGPASGGGAAPNLTYAEYYVDADPGYRLGTRVNFAAPGASVDQNFVADLSGVSNGIHTLFVRVRNAAGAWSLTSVRPFVRQGNVPGGARPLITRFRYQVFPSGSGTASGPAEYYALPVPARAADVDVTFPTNVCVSAAGSYVLRVEALDANGVPTLAYAHPFTVTMPSQFNPNLPAALAGCTGQPLTITSAPAGAGGSYQWSRNGTALPGETNQALTVTTAGTYAVAVTSGQGCTGTGSSAVTFSAAPTIALAPFTDVPCGQASALLDAGAGYASYTWTPGGATTRTIAATTPGTYAVTVTGASTGTCTATASTLVRMPKADIVQNNTSQCAGTATTLTLATPVNGTIAWAANGLTISGQTGTSLSVGPASTTTYTATVSDGSFACSDAVTLTIAPPAAVTLAAQPTASLATAPFALAGGLPAGGTYGGPGVSANVFDPAAAGVGTHTISYTYAAGGCPATATRPLTVEDTVLVVYDLALNQCLVSDPIASTGSGLWQRLRLNGQTVAALNDQGRVLGTVRVEFTVVSGPVRQDARGRKYLARNWHVVAQNPLGAGNSALVRLYGLTTEFDQLRADDPANVTALGSLRLTQYSGPNEDCSLANNGGAGASTRLLVPQVTGRTSPPYFVAQATVTDHFSEFYLGGGNRPLPVELTEFRALRRGRDVLATWATATEANSAWFALEASASGRTGFAEVGRVAAAGTSAAPRRYALTDRNVPTASPLRYYRLRQTDADGRTSFGPVQAVWLDQADPPLALQARPNPFRTNELVVSIVTPAAAAATLQLRDLAGRALLTQNLTLAAGFNALSLPELAALPAGIYVIVLQSKAEVRQVKLVKE